MAGDYDLERFVSAQEGVIEQVVRELRQGQKQSHWMWFVFPQIAGLGQSATARRFAIGSLAEAEAYLEHPVLGLRLRECTRLVNAIEGRPVEEIFGYPDDLKFRSSMSLFARTAADNRIFLDALEKYFAGVPDPLTLERLGEKPSRH